MKRWIWQHMAVLLSCALILALSGSNLSAKPGAYGAEVPKEEFDKMLTGYSELEDNLERAKHLFTLFEQSPMLAFDTVYHALVNDSGLVQGEATRIIGHYYVAIQVFPEKSVRATVETPDHGPQKRAAVVEKLNSMRATDMIPGRYYALESLVRMGETDERIPDELSSIALGEGAEEWQYYDSPEMPLSVAGKKELEMDYKKDAVRLLAVLYENGIYPEKTFGYLKTILKGLDPDTRFYEILMGNPMLRAIASEKYR